MGGLFSFDNPIMQGLNKLIDTLFLGLLFVVFSIPVFTIGASVSALYYTANKSMRNGRGYVWQQFWNGFKSAFKQGSLATLLLGAIAFVLYMDTRAIRLFMEVGKMSEGVGIGARTFFFILMALVLILAFWYFIYIARFSAPFKTGLRNCGLMMIRHLMTTVLAVIIVFIAGFLIYLFMPSVVGILLLVALPPLAALLLTFPFEKVFRKYMSEEDRSREDKLNGKEYL